MICLFVGYEQNVVSFCLHIFFVGLVVDCGYCNTWSKYMKRKTDFLPTWSKTVFNYNIYIHIYPKCTKCPNVQYDEGLQIWSKALGKSTRHWVSKKYDEHTLCSSIAKVSIVFLYELFFRHGICYIIFARSEYFYLLLFILMWVVPAIKDHG